MMKKALSIFLVVCCIFLGSSCGTQKKNPHLTDTTIVYWVPKGKVYHVTKKCSALRRSLNIESGTIEEAKADGKMRVCEDCGYNYVDDTQ